MSHKQRSTKWAIKTTYTKEGVPYACPQFGELVNLDCFFELDAPQGSEGFLSPCSCKVRCSEANRCRALKDGRCPLERGVERGGEDVLNNMAVSVLEGERALLLDDDGAVFEVGDIRPDGCLIWFGSTSVFGDATK
jgi:hypothetical protein